VVTFRTSFLFRLNSTNSVVPLFHKETTRILNRMLETLFRTPVKPDHHHYDHNRCTEFYRVFSFSGSYRLLTSVDGRPSGAASRDSCQDSLGNPCRSSSGDVTRPRASWTPTATPFAAPNVPRSLSGAPIEKQRRPISGRRSKSNRGGATSVRLRSRRSQSNPAARH